MNESQQISSKLSEFLIYLAEFNRTGEEKLPALSDISEELGISVSTIREQLQVARSMGLVEVKPRTGIRTQPYSFTPTIIKSLAYAVSINKDYFITFSDLRNHIEATYWYQAVSKLTEEDIQYLKVLINNAKGKLFGQPIQIPHYEHRELHITIFKRLNNPFVTGILEAYWELYEAVGLNVYEDRTYLKTVWGYHQQMVEAIESSDYLTGYQALVEHMDLLHKRKNSESQALFE